MRESLGRVQCLSAALLHLLVLLFGRECDFFSARQPGILVNVSESGRLRRDDLVAELWELLRVSGRVRPQVFVAADIAGRDSCFLAFRAFVFATVFPTVMAVVSLGSARVTVILVALTASRLF